MIQSLHCGMDDDDFFLEPTGVQPSVSPPASSSTSHKIRSAAGGIYDVGVDRGYATNPTRSHPTPCKIRSCHKGQRGPGLEWLRPHARIEGDRQRKSGVDGRASKKCRPRVKAARRSHTGDHFPPGLRGKFSLPMGVRGENYAYPQQPSGWVRGIDGYYVLQVRRGRDLCCDHAGRWIN